MLARAGTPPALLTALVFVSGTLSAFLVNDAVCVMLVPLVLAMLERGDVPIRPYLFAIAAGANVESVMTVVGNPQNMIIAHAAPVVGSAVNVIVFGTARDHAGIGFWEFLRVGAPITVVTTLVGVVLPLVLT